MTQHRTGLFRNGDRWCSSEELSRLEREAELSDDPGARAALRRARTRCGRAPVESIRIRGRHWRDSNGNTYHTAKVWVDGKQALIVPFAYGYGAQYVWSAAEALVRANILPKGIGLDPQPYSGGRPDNPGIKPLWVYCAERGIKLDYSVENVRRKRDLHLGGKKR